MYRPGAAGRMLSFVCDENFSGRMSKAVRRRLPGVDWLTFDETGLPKGTPDPDVLAWAAERGRILVSHDRETMIKFATDRVNDGLPMPGLVVVRDAPNIRPAVADLAYIIQAGNETDFVDRPVYVPL